MSNFKSHIRVKYGLKILHWQLAYSNVRDNAFYKDEVVFSSFSNPRMFKGFFQRNRSGAMCTT